MATDYGTDVSCFPDLDPASALVSGQRALAQALARRLTTAHGTVVWDPDYGWDLRVFLNGPLTSVDLFAAKAGAERECEKDERVNAISADVSFDQPTQTMKVALSIESAAGPFTMVLAVSAVTVSILKLG